MAINFGNIAKKISSGFGKVGNFLGSAGGSFVGQLGANSLSSWKQYNYQKKLMRLQADLNYDYAKRTAIKQYGWARKGLESANYNPLLAVQGISAPISSSMASGSPSAPSFDYGTALSNASNMNLNKSTLQLNDSQSRLLSAQAEATPELMASQTFKNNSSAWLDQYKSITQQLENNFLPEKQKEELRVMKSITYSNIVNANSNMYNAQTQRAVGNSQRKLMQGQIDLMIKQGNLTESQGKYIKMQMRYLPASQIGSFIRDLGIGVGAGVGAGLGAYQQFGIKPSAPIGF